jgi:predicted Zn-dependent peptidase
MFGSGPDSLLFRRIREELNKVYFIGTMYDQYKGSMLLYAGINASDKDVVMEEIAAMIARIINKDISEQALQIAKTSLIQNLIESMDSIHSITSRIHHLAVFGKTFDQDRLIKTITDTTMDDVVAIAKKLTLDTTYLLRGEIDA